MKHFLSLIICFALSSCSSIRFDIRGVDRDIQVSEVRSGCMQDSDCSDGKVCATVKGEFPGSCAGKGDDGLIIGAIILGAAAAANSGGGGYPAPASYGPSPASYNQYRVPRQDLRGCCSYHGGINYCSYGRLYCNDGWVSGCGCQ